MKTMKNLFGIMLMLAFSMTVYAQENSGQTPQAGNDETHFLFYFFPIFTMIRSTSIH